MWLLPSRRGGGGGSRGRERPWIMVPAPPSLHSRTRLSGYLFIPAATPRPLQPGPVGLERSPAAVFLLLTFPWFACPRGWSPTAALIWYGSHGQPPREGPDCQRSPSRGPREGQQFPAPALLCWVLECSFSSHRHARPVLPSPPHTPADHALTPTEKHEVPGLQPTGRQEPQIQPPTLPDWPHAP